MYGLTRAARLPFSLRDQLEWAALSVSNNIAEGFERGTTKELLTFIYTACGSAGEVRSILCLVESLEQSPLHLKSQISNLRSLSESLARQLRAWADALQNSSVKGQRYLTAAGRQEAKQDAAWRAFQAETAKRIEARARTRQAGPGTTGA